MKVISREKNSSGEVVYLGIEFTNEEIIDALVRAQLVPEGMRPYSWRLGTGYTAVEFERVAAQETFVCLGGCGASVLSADAYCSACFQAERRKARETSPVQAVCDRAAHLADVPTPMETGALCPACQAPNTRGALPPSGLCTVCEVL